MGKWGGRVSGSWREVGVACHPKRFAQRPLKVFFREGEARPRLEVFFEGGGLILIREADGRFQFPWAELGGVRGAAGIVLRQACVQIVGHPDIALVGVVPTAQDVNGPHKLDNSSRGSGCHACGDISVTAEALPLRDTKGVAWEITLRACDLEGWLENPVPLRQPPSPRLRRSRGFGGHPSLFTSGFRRVACHP